MNTYLLDRIRDITGQKKASHQEPTHVLFYRDLMSPETEPEELKSQLRQLAREGKIKVGNTINDYFIKLNE